MGLHSSIWWQAWTTADPQSLVWEGGLSVQSNKKRSQNIPGFLPSVQNHLDRVMVTAFQICTSSSLGQPQNYIGRKPQGPRSAKLLVSIPALMLMSAYNKFEKLFMGPEQVSEGPQQSLGVLTSQVQASGLWERLSLSTVLKAALAWVVNQPEGVWRTQEESEACRRTLTL